MIPKLDIDKKIAEQKNKILQSLAEKIKLPITDITKHSFDYRTLRGQFVIVIGEKSKQFLDFKYENQEFILFADAMQTNLNSLWSNIYNENKDVIHEKMIDGLNLSAETLKGARIGQSGIVYINEQGAFLPMAVACEYEDGQWIVKIRS